MASQKQSSRDTILATASRLFATQGYHGTGLNQIIKESGAPKGSLYYYFPEGKEELALQCIKHIRNLLMGNLMENFSDYEAPTLGIQNFIRNLATEVHKEGYTNFLPLGFWVAAETSMVSNALRNECQLAFAEWNDAIAAKLMEDGFSEEKAQSLGMLLISMMEGAAILTITRQNNEPLLQVAEHIPILLKA
ncbi:TetR family transcriptional regulator [Paenibacillus sp. LMG 31456]|uniref:TetR family transcriptional regulator n=1 Tax=Paenibacillus foliorum TaxID=2654974 RepID=A0A972GN36_9BACL|nr:TetR/AcrR family transcriptional regulator [Paenibacillus foliorum]NOU93717.1 TetR family transcriptional regulator [Paenibacillus foliorum]